MLPQRLQRKVLHVVIGRRGGGDDGQIILHKLPENTVAVRRGRTRHADFGLAGHDGLHNPLAVAPLDVKGDRPVALAEGRHELRQHILIGDGGGRDADNALQTAPILTGGQRLIPQGEHVEGIVVKRPPHIGGLGRLAPPLDEGGAQLALQSGDVGAHRRLGEKERLGRPGKAPQPNHISKSLKLLEIHGYASVG